jgi:negative regulator of replication initiation
VNLNVDINLGQYIFTHVSQQGELAHRLVKQLYSLTNKKNAIQQIGKKYMRQQAFRSAERQEEKEADKASHLSDHHIISRTKNAPLNLLSFAQTNGDPAKKVWQ